MCSLVLVGGSQRHRYRWVMDPKVFGTRSVSSLSAFLPVLLVAFAGGCATVRVASPAPSVEPPPPRIVSIDPEEYYPQNMEAELVVRVDRLRRSPHVPRIISLIERFGASRHEDASPHDIGVLIDGTKEIRVLMAGSPPDFFGSAVAKRSFSAGEERSRRTAVILVQGTYSFEQLQGIGGEQEQHVIAGHRALFGETAAMVELPGGWWLLADQVHAEALLASPERPATLERPEWVELEQFLPNAAITLRVLPVGGEQERRRIEMPFFAGAFSLVAGEAFRFAALLLGTGEAELREFTTELEGGVLVVQQLAQQRCDAHRNPEESAPSQNEDDDLFGAGGGELYCAALSSIETVALEQDGAELRIRGTLEAPLIEQLLGLAERFIGLLEGIRSMAQPTP